MKKSEVKIIRYSPLSIEDWREKKKRWGLRPATMQQTMGPNWRHIVSLITKKGVYRPFAVYNEDQFLADNS